MVVLMGSVSSLLRGEFDWKRCEAVGPVGAQALRLAGEADVREAAQDLLEGDAQLEPREPGAEAEVAPAAAEGHVRGLGAGDVEALADRR